MRVTITGCDLLRNWMRECYRWKDYKRCVPFTTFAYILISFFLTLFKPKRFSRLTWLEAIPITKFLLVLLARLALGLLNKSPATKKKAVQLKSALVKNKKIKLRSYKRHYENIEDNDYLLFPSRLFLSFCHIFLRIIRPCNWLTKITCIIVPMLFFSQWKKCINFDV